MAAPLITLSIALLTACGDSGDSGGPVDGKCFEPTLSLDVCDPANATFTLDSTNAYYPLVVGDKVILEGMDEGDLLRVEREVLAETEMVGGVETHVLEHKEFVNGEIYEIAKNFYVETTDGVVCYFGEDVEFYEGGELANMNGTWRVGENDARPGIIMPAAPEVGQSYFQESSEGEAMDMGRVTEVGGTVTMAGETFEDVVTIMDSNPIDDEDPCEEERKLYAPGIGEIADVDLELISYEAGSS